MIPDAAIPLYAGLGLAVGLLASYGAAVLVDGMRRAYRRYRRRRNP